jgi:F420-dependent oxidoreductase-like protein
MRVGIKLAPQHTTIDELRAVWRIADETGFDSCWTFDHFAPIGGDDLSGDVLEGWTLLAAMAETTSRVRIGCMVTGNTYRHPAVLAKMAATVDHLSGGRLEFGLGAAWVEAEHTMLGLEFGAVRDRLDRLEEACEIVTSLWTRPTTTFEGRHYHLRDAVSNPRPLQQPHPPLWIGGNGRRRTLRIVARWADAWNASTGSPDEITELQGILDGHCADVGRDPASIRRTVQLRVDDQPEAIPDRVAAFAAVGVSEVIVIVRPGAAVDDANRLAAMLPALRG